MRRIIDRLGKNHELSDEELLMLMTETEAENREYLFAKARAASQQVYGNDIYIRGLIEVSNYCKNNCYYCGIRCGNEKISRYRLSEATILDCCALGDSLGFRTFVLQGGEDRYFDDDRLCSLIKTIKERYPHCAVTLSLGERSSQSYQRLFDAGADRYLLRHETIDREHYQRLHPPRMQWEHRLMCLQELKRIGFQVGCGMMVGSPLQTPAHLLADLRFMQKFRPHMVGIGPFLPQRDTPFGAEPAGSAEKTLVLLAIIRLLLPYVLLPATTALGSAAEDGRERGILAGANVIMPNLSPPEVREKYLLYDHKRSFGSEAAEGLAQLKGSMEKIGYRIVTDRGDCNMNCRENKD